MAHEVGALVYCDGANMNALLGTVQPAALGLDVLHLNLHKTFTTPHGGGGPGAGAICVNETLESYLPVPLVKEADGAYAWDYDRPDSIGRIHSFYGNFLNQVRAYTYICSLGNEGIKRAGEYAVLNANYLKERLRKAYALRYDRTCMHEVVFAGLKEKAEGRAHAGRRQAHDRLRLPSLHGLFPAHCAGSPDDRADGDRKHRHPRRLCGRFARHRRGSANGSGETQGCPRLRARAPSRRDHRRPPTQPALATAGLVQRGTRKQHWAVDSAASSMSKRLRGWVRPWLRPDLC